MLSVIVAVLLCLCLNAAPAAAMTCTTHTYSVDVLTPDVLPADCTLTGQAEACCPRCWPLITRRADGTLSRERWDRAVVAARHERETRAQELFAQYGIWVGE